MSDEQKPGNNEGDDTGKSPWSGKSRIPGPTPEKKPDEDPFGRKQTRRKVKPQFDEGEVIADRYRVIKMIGHGGMGIVYLVKDDKTDRRVALKTLLPHYAANAHAVKRFMREVETAQQLDHKCIIKMYEARQVDDLLFYTMEYVEGISLFQWMHKRGKMGLGSVVRVLSLLCHALEHAHTITIHRDLSPDNVMVLKDGSIKLMDFGLAKLTNVESNLTMIGVSLGKQQYMAPEQRISAADVDYRADLYSVGVMFFELLAGELPSSKNSFRALRPDLPAECENFVKKAMSHDPAGRFQSAREMREALLYLYKLQTGEAKETPPPFDIGDAASAQEIARSTAPSNLPPMSAKPTSTMMPRNVPTPPPIKPAPIPRGGLVGLWDRFLGLFRR